MRTMDWVLLVQGIILISSVEVVLTPRSGMSSNNKNATKYWPLIGCKSAEELTVPNKKN